MTTFNPKALTTALKSLSSPTKSPVNPNAAFALIRHVAGSTTIETTNESLRYRVIRPIFDGDDFECLVHADMASNALSSSSEESASIRIEGNRVKIESGKRKSSIPCLEVTDESWVNPKPKQALHEFTLKAGEVFSTLKLCVGIARVGKSRMYGWIDIASIEDVIRIMATDGRLLHNHETSTIHKQPFAVAVPLQPIADLLGVIDDEGEIGVEVFEKSIRFTSGDISIETSLDANESKAKRIHGAMGQVLGNTKRVDYSMNRAEFTAAIDSANSIIPSGEQERIRVEVGEGVVSVSAETSNSHTESQVECASTGHTMYHVNGKLASMLISAFGYEDVKLSRIENAMVVHQFNGVTSILMEVRGE